MQNKLKIALKLAQFLKVNVNISEIIDESQEISSTGQVFTKFYYSNTRYEHIEHAFMCLGSDYIPAQLRVDQPEEEEPEEEEQSGQLVTVLVYKSWKENDWKCDGALKLHRKNHKSELLQRTARKYGEWYKLTREVPSSHRSKITFMVHESRVHTMKLGEI
jgi:hypothetical protein